MVLDEQGSEFCLPANKTGSEIDLGATVHAVLLGYLARTSQLLTETRPCRGQLSSDLGTIDIVEARFWPWLQSFFRRKSLKHLTFCPPFLASGTGVYPLLSSSWRTLPRPTLSLSTYLIVVDRLRVGWLNEFSFITSTGEGCRESRRYSKDTYVDSYTTKYTSMLRASAGT